MYAYIVKLTLSLPSLLWGDRSSGGITSSPFASREKTRGTARFELPSWFDANNPFGIPDGFSWIPQESNPTWSSISREFPEFRIYSFSDHPLSFFFPPEEFQIPEISARTPRFHPPRVAGSQNSDFHPPPDSGIPDFQISTPPDLGGPRFPDFYPPRIPGDPDF